MKRTQKAHKLSLFGLAALLALFNATAVKAENSSEITIVMVEKSPEQKAFEIFEGFFTKENYEVKQSFSAMCCEAAQHLEKSTDPVLQDLARALKVACKESNAFSIAMALKKHEATIKKFVGKMVSPTILLTRFNKALQIK